LNLIFRYVFTDFGGKQYESIEKEEKLFFQSCWDKDE